MEKALSRALKLLVRYAILAIFAMLQGFGAVGEPEPSTPVEQVERPAPSTEGEIQPPEENHPEPQASLALISHLTSPREGVTLEQFAKLRGLAVSGESIRVSEELDISGARRFDTAGAVVEHVSRTPEAVGLVPWDQVDARVKALEVEGVSLFTSGSKKYPRELRGKVAPDPEEVREIVVAGDVVLDRGLPYAVFQQGGGMDFPLEGGHAAVTWRSPVQSQYSEHGVIHTFRAERRGGSGAVREYLNGADLTLANLENPVLKNATYHPEGTVFNGDLRLLPILGDAGIDGVTLANNHVMDAHIPGLAETIGHLDDAGMPHAGAGMSLEEARGPMVFDLGGLKVGVLSYQGVPGYETSWATPASPGTAPLRMRIMERDIRKMEPQVDVIFVMPHWGMEYTATPERKQVRFARAAVEAGADIVVGGHAHWPKGMEIHDESPIFYGTGNFLLDQSWSEETSIGIFADITLYKDRIVQARPVPFVVLDHAQPNFLLPEGGGNRALEKVFASSIGPEFADYTRP
jgi:poly-gamma-glutamate capsule biosynthesis protein CapA/YwtB (metallophosphatase superfamily)